MAAERGAVAKSGGRVKNTSGAGGGNATGKGNGNGNKTTAAKPKAGNAKAGRASTAPAPTSKLGVPSTPPPAPATQSGFAAAAPWISLVARLALGAMWLYYCVPKLGSPAVNEASVRNFRILSGGMVNTFAYAQPYVELALGLLIIAGLGTRLVAALSGLLLLVYIGGIASLGARGIHITCGCGGAGGEVAAGQTRYTLDILRDVLYLVPVAWLLWKPKSKFSADAVLLPEPIPATPLPTPRSATAKGGPRR
jgi:uncharacterized membrane protein YphA (DoxX/SURF4 family)